MSVQVTDDVAWIGQCYPHDGAHEHVSLYVVNAEEGYVVVDSGSFYHREAIETAVDEATDGAGPDAIVLSHSDYPHAANVSTLKEAGVELVASSGDPESQGLPDARKSDIGGELSICGRSFSFLDPPLADRSHTTWIYDHGDGVLFTADGFGHYHEPGECADRSTDFEEGIPRHAIRAFHEDNLVWLRYVEPRKIERALRAIFETYDVGAVAPIHGNPIVGDDVDRYLSKLLDAVEAIAASYVPGDGSA